MPANMREVEEWARGLDPEGTQGVTYCYATAIAHQLRSCLFYGPMYRRAVSDNFRDAVHAYHAGNSTTANMYHDRALVHADLLDPDTYYSRAERGAYG